MDRMDAELMAAYQEVSPEGLINRHCIPKLPQYLAEKRKNQPRRKRC